MRRMLEVSSCRGNYMNLDLNICRHTYGDGWDGGISGRLENGCRAFSLPRHEIDHWLRVPRLMAILIAGR